jgi:hypothetical protein
LLPTRTPLPLAVGVRPNVRPARAQVEAVTKDGATFAPDGHPQHFVSRGVIERVNTTTLRIRELPVGRWTEDYKARASLRRASPTPGAACARSQSSARRVRVRAQALLEKLAYANSSSSARLFTYREQHTDVSTDFVISGTRVRGRV